MLLLTLATAGTLEWGRSQLAALKWEAEEVQAGTFTPTGAGKLKGPFGKGRRGEGGPGGVLLWKRRVSI